MKAKVSKAFDENKPELDLWCVMIQSEPGARYNVPVISDGKMLSFDNKKDANKYVKELNLKLTNK